MDVLTENLINIGIVSSIVVGVTTVGIKINTNLNKRFRKKADTCVVEDKFKAMHERINRKADLTAFREFDKKLDVIIKLTNKKK